MAAVILMRMLSPLPDPPCMTSPVLFLSSHFTRHKPPPAPHHYSSPATLPADEEFQRSLSHVPSDSCGGT
ncbi:hypothetical protein E2C01_070237 [Portunus trituberculatus]|uniref:Uncharacterized protein n=1 Tax=Portunus trituberculatus TaxID=210409 RepID=A0A5B7HTN2_PORTR|nr:hypothetical protein [Portunus trituberculatus]